MRGAIKRRKEGGKKKEVLGSSHWTRQTKTSTKSPICCFPHRFSAVLFWFAFVSVLALLCHSLRFISLWLIKSKDQKKGSYCSERWITYFNFLYQKRLLLPRYTSVSALSIRLLTTWIQFSFNQQVCDTISLDFHHKHNSASVHLLQFPTLHPQRVRIPLYWRQWYNHQLVDFHLQHERAFSMAIDSYHPELLPTLKRLSTLWIKGNLHLAYLIKREIIDM